MSPPWPPGLNERIPLGNGDSSNVVFSQDNRQVRLIAYESAASNLVPGDTNGMRDVFAVRRSPGGGNLFGVVERASVGSDGEQANGPSALPSLDGETRARPRCVAFQSRATNLARGDTSRDLDIYVRQLDRGRTVLASPRMRDASHAVIDGRCVTVTFASGGKVWVRDLRRGRTYRLAMGKAPDQQTNGEGVAYERRGHVWYRRFVLRRGRLKLGREVLVSADRYGKPGNGRSGDPMLDDAGHYVVFESRATNLCLRTCTGISRDRNGRVIDVFRRTLGRHAPTRDRMQMASFSHATNVQGDGASLNPAISGAGENIVFQSRATNLHQRPGRHKPDRNGSEIEDIYSWTFPRGRRRGNVILQTGILCQEFDTRCATSSVAPSMSSRGNYLGYTSWLSTLCDDGRRPEFGDRACPSPSDAMVYFVGGSHEGHPLG